jgi:hypothetical protein
MGSVMGAALVCPHATIMKDKKTLSIIDLIKILCKREHIEKLSLLSNTSNKRPTGSLIMYALCKQPLVNHFYHL